jgi:SHS2 domain-containing protein
VYSFFDHTADIGVHLDGDTLEALFAAGASALADTLTDPRAVEPREAQSLTLTNAELDLLLHDWLSELLYLFDAKRLLVAGASLRVTEEHEGWRLEGTVRGEHFNPERHPIKVLVKAITYHALAVTHDDAGWHATVILDI